MVSFRPEEQKWWVNTMGAYRHDANPRLLCTAFPPRGRIMRRAFGIGLGKNKQFATVLFSVLASRCLWRWYGVVKAHQHTAVNRRWQGNDW